MLVPTEESLLDEYEEKERCGGLVCCSPEKSFPGKYAPLYAPCSIEGSTKSLKELIGDGVGEGGNFWDTTLFCSCFSDNFQTFFPSK